MRYFIAGNMWLLVALVILLGRKGPPGGSNSFFGIGGLFSSGTYNLTWVLCFVLGMVFLDIARKHKQD